MVSLLKKMFSSEKFTLTPEHQKCLRLLEETSENIIITGKAGTGKSTLIQYFRSKTKKKIVVLAPTGIAALNIKGQTIHSFFKFPPRLIDLQSIRRNNNSRIYSDIDTLIIDEISMVRADILDGIDKFLRIHGKDRDLPFGGVQMVFVGDLYQLPPIVTREEFEIFNRFYTSPYFFSANSFDFSDFNVIELNSIFRQQDVDFINLLNLVRNGEAKLKDLDLINNRVNNKKISDNTIILCTTNKVAEGINQTKLNAINKPLFSYIANVEGIFPTEERNLPVESELKLKVGARVLFVKNDAGGQWVNGTLGVVHNLEEDLVQVKIDDSGKIVDVYIDQWENIRYELDEEKNEIIPVCLGRFKQYPLKLAWAVTIHKSQGMSFEKVCIDFSRSPFAHGQTYVALSRCRKLEGLVLTRKIWPNDVLIDDRIVEFYRKIS